MSLEQNFKKSVLSILSQYEEKQQHITIEEAQVISHARQLVKETDGLIKLRQELINLIEKLPGRFFSFLPFVKDLKKDLRDLLADPQYSLEILFTFEATILREENSLLKSKLIQLESRSHTDQIQQSATDKDLYQKITLLEKEFTQSSQLLQIENRELVQQLLQSQSKNTVLQTTVKNLQSQVDITGSKMGLLQKELLEKNAEIVELRAENELLKRGQKEEGANSTSHLFRK